MTQWTGGYVEGIDYTHGYYRELGPLHAAMTLSHAGVRNRALLLDFVQHDICVHGIWCWVSPANQALIVDFVRRKLKVGGVRITA